MKNIFDLLKKLTENGFEAYIVGGFVRDKLLNRCSYDVDICTSAKIDDILKIFPFAKSKGFYCFSFELDNYHIEITSFRKESHYDGRRPQHLEYGSLLDDLQRRDFTINTLLMDETGHILDNLGGINDLKNKVLKVVGNSNQKIKDDALRILRAIRIASNLNFSFDKDLHDAIKKYAKNVKNLSIQRIREELDKIIQDDNALYGLSLFKKYHLDTYLNINIPSHLKITHNYIGIYMQMKISDFYFTKKERKTIHFLSPFLHKKLDKYDLYLLKDKNILLLDEINNTHYIDMYHLLPIKKDSDVHITYNCVKEILKSKNISFKDIKKEIIIALLNKQLKNNKEDIITYINNHF